MPEKKEPGTGSFNYKNNYRTLNNKIKGNLFPLNREEAIEAMKAGERLVDGVRSYDIAHYHWHKNRVMVSDSHYDLNGEGYKIAEDKLPQLYRLGKEGTFSSIAAKEAYWKNRSNGNLIHDAINFAVSKHSEKTHEAAKKPRITHPFEVMKILTENGCSENARAAGILHDVLEDTDATEEEIRKNFGDDVLKIVAAESGDKTKSWEERKQAAIDGLSEAGYEVKMLFFADMLSSLRSMATNKKEFGEILWNEFNAPKKSIEWYYRQVFRKISDIRHPEMKKEFAFLFDEVFNEGENFMPGKNKKIIQFPNINGITGANRNGK